MLYFQRWVEHSDILHWEQRSYDSSTTTNMNGPSTSTDASAITPPAALTYVDLDEFTLGFRDDDGSSEFVYGGDVFDQGGADLTFSRALLDFKKRFPHRVHLILGNRDLNKMVMRHIFSSPTRAAQAPEEAAKDVETLKTVDKDAKHTTSELRQLAFPPGVAGHLNPLDAEEALFPAKSGPPAKVSYLDYLREERKRKYDKTREGNDEQGREVADEVADPVSFLKWALVHRLGSPNAFEHRRRELHEIQKRKLSQARGEKEELVRCSSLPLPTDEEVAASYAAAAEPGGAFYEYLLHGQLLHVIGSTLFVHGGICEDNLGLVPSLSAPYDDPMRGCRAMLDVVRGDANAASASSTTSTTAATPLSLLDWFEALHRFKDDAFQEYVLWTGNKGESLRRYGNHCFCTRYSVTVNSLMNSKNGPSYFSLPVVQYLLTSGIQYVCVGHMPTGDTPAIIRQPPLGTLTCIAADNSYCGRGNQFCTPQNPRGMALTEVIVHLTPPPSSVGDCGEGKEKNAGGMEQEEETSVDVEDYVLVHGFRADGNPFRFEVRSDDLFLGRCLQRVPSSDKEGGSGDQSSSPITVEHWWVKRRGIYMKDGKQERGTNESNGEEYYALHCTTDSFFSEKERLYSVSDLEDAFYGDAILGADLLLGERLQQGTAVKKGEDESITVPPPPVGGILRDTHTADSLRNVHVHRIKTKVKPSTTEAL